MTPDQPSPPYPVSPLHRLLRCLPEVAPPLPAAIPPYPVPLQSFDQCHLSLINPNYPFSTRLPPSFASQQKKFPFPLGLRHDLMNRSRPGSETRASLPVTPVLVPLAYSCANTIAGGAAESTAHIAVSRLIAWSGTIS